MKKMDRREFFGVSAGVAAAASLLPSMKAMAQTKGGDTAHIVEDWPENGTLIPDDGWRLWVDREAEWKNDEIYLPDQISQDADGVVRGDGKPLPVNAPTGGWSVLGGKPEGSIEVNLPGTVEQHFWGKYGAGEDGKPRSYTPEEYRYAADDPVPQNGAFFGVSWWWREVEIPASMQGKRIFLHVRGAHLRAEVYLNGKLCGYSIMEELPFEAELTHAANPGGKNVLAIRITNPFGRFDWVDGLNAQWGAVKLYRSHGFGGMDRGLTISAHEGPIRITDAYVLNTPDPKHVVAYVKLTGWKPEHGPIAILINVVDPTTGKVIDGNLGPYPPPDPAWDADRPLGFNITTDTAQQWTLDTPKLYRLTITLAKPDSVSKDGGVVVKGGLPVAKHVDRTLAFAYRSFAVDGPGSNALFRLNGKRMKIYTAISWGYWGINGMWPTPELAVKEVTQAKKLGLTCLNFHRNLAKEDVLRAHDRLGLLRYMEPGAGKMAIGRLPSGVQANSAGIVMEKPTSEADKFAQKYMFTKCVEMVKAFRSHPSVIEYCLQNEIGADLKNPDTIAVLEAMHKEDPSRCVVLNDGFVAPPRKAAQAWYAPWDADLKPGKLHRSDEEEWGGWWNQHQGAGDQWYDEFYKGPDNFTYKAPFKDVITEFGEMEGCATPDNHSLMLHELADPKGTGIGNQPANQSYDLKDHQEIEAAASAFLTKWGFRKAFPATERLWTSLGKKCYDTWQNYMENARISDWLDFCAISGWESTAIENHSGIVDNLRNFKSDPEPIAGTLMRVRPVAKQHAACTALGDTATFDLFLLNDTSKAVAGTLEFSVVTPSGKRIKLGSFPAPEQQTPDVFSYQVKEGFVTPKLDEEGMWRFRFALSTEPASTQTKEIWVTEPPAVKRAKTPKVAVSGISSKLHKELEAMSTRLGFAVEEFKAGERYDGIISAGLVAGVSGKQNSGDTTGLEAQPATAANGRKLEPGEGPQTKQVGHIDAAVLEAVKAGTPLLTIPQADALSDGVAKQLADAGAFEYHGNVGDFRAPWMGNWYFVREHPVYRGMPVNQAMGIHYQVKGRESNGLLVDGPHVEIIAAYGRDHDRNFGAGTFTTKLGQGKVLYHRVPEMHPVLQQRFLANALQWLVG